MSVQCLTQANVISSGARAVKLVAVVNGDILIGTPTSLLIASGGNNVFGTTDTVYSATVFSNVYFTNGSTVIRLDCSTGSASTFTATDGTLPSGCRLICTWRSRLVLARQDTAPHLWFMSRVGDPTDWDYGETDPAAAVAGNNSDAGLIGDVITALMPASDDVLFIGGDHSLWRLSGDPQDGGTILPVSEQIGVLSGRAWTQDPDGWIYFVSPQGLYRVSASGALQQISDARVSAYFQEIDIGSQTVSLVWDRDRIGLWILRSESSGTDSKHLFWDARTKGFFPQKSANADIRPQCALMYDGDSPDDRKLCFGGASDKIYYYDESVVNDAGTAITTYVYIGPSLPNGYQGEARGFKLESTIGEYPTRGSFASILGVTWTLQAAEDPYAAVNNPAETATGTWTTASNVGRQDQRLVSIRGRTFVLKLSDFSTSYTWVYDKSTLAIHPAGVGR